MAGEQLLPIGLGDLIRVVHQLGLGESDARLVADLLGVSRAAPPTPTLKSGPGWQRPSDAPPSRRSQNAPAPSPTRAPYLGEAAREPPPALDGLTLEELPSAPATPPRWLASEAMPVRPSSRQKKPLEPLLVPRTMRGLLSATLATQVSSDELDLEQLLEGLSERRALLDLPRRRLPSLRRGVQLLVDRGDAMLPFFADADDLVQRVRDVVSSEATTVLYFQGNPAECQRESTFESSAYRPPARETPVLALTDLGVRSAAHRRAWRCLAQTLRDSGNLLTALVPYPRERWPQGFERLMTILPWDRRTTLRTLRRQRAERAR